MVSVFYLSLQDRGFDRRAQGRLLADQRPAYKLLTTISPNEASDRFKR